MQESLLPPRRGPRQRVEDIYPEPPEIEDDDNPIIIIEKLARFLEKTIDTPRSFEDLRTVAFGHVLSPLIDYLSENVHNVALVNCLLALRSHFASTTEEDDRSVGLTRAYACEIVAWRFVTRLSEIEALDYLLHDLSYDGIISIEQSDEEAGSTSRFLKKSVNASSIVFEPSEHTSLLQPKRTSALASSLDTRYESPTPKAQIYDVLLSEYSGLNALEIAAVSKAKKFLSQHSIQKIINGIWYGNIVFWDKLSVNTKKRPQLYNKSCHDSFCRLRVPRYLKVYEVLFFAAFIALYYGVLVQRNPTRFTALESILLVWIAAFAYDEFGQFLDAGSSLYAADFWSFWDFGIIAVGVAFLVARCIGLAKHNSRTTDMAFDILALEALFLVPRICSLLSLNPFFGTLIPCLKEMTAYSTKFLGLVAILYLGFLTTFTLLARGVFTPIQMSWMLIKVFFGSSYIGFDAAEQISPVLGAPLMLIFVWITNILLLTTLISVLSNRLSEVMEHAREEFLFIYSVYVLEASTSNRLTYYLPPLNLLSLVFRPMRLFSSAETVRSHRIVLLKITHLPHVAAIWVFESFLQTPLQDAGRYFGLETAKPVASKDAGKYSNNSPRPGPSPISARNFGGRWHTNDGAVKERRDCHTATPPLAASDHDTTMLQLRQDIAELTAKVNDLVAIIAQQQNQRDDN